MSHGGVVAFVLMPNHWHFVLWPEYDKQLSEFCRWLTHTHSMNGMLTTIPRAQAISTRDVKRHFR